MIAFDVADVAGSTDATAAEVRFSASLLLSLHKKQSCAIGWSSRLRSREWWQGQSAKELCILRRGGSGQSAERTQQRGDYDMFELEHRQSEPIKLTMLDIGGAVRDQSVVSHPAGTAFCVDLKEPFDRSYMPNRTYTICRTKH